MAPQMLERQIRFDLRLSNANGGWSLRWVRAADGIENGVWLAAQTPVEVRQALPTYRFDQLALHWDDSPGTSVNLSHARVIEFAYGIPIRERPLKPITSAEFVTTSSDGSLPLSGFTGFGRTAYAGGYAITLLGLGIVFAVVAVTARVRWTNVARRAPWPVLAIVLVALVRVWVATWAPFFYSWDSMDYFAKGLEFLRSHSLEQFDAIRPAGYSLWLALCLSLGAAPSLTIPAASALLGVATAVLTYLMLRRFVAPPWPVVGLLLVGLDPILLMFERYALTETLTTFLVVLIVWAVTTPFARDATRLSGRVHELCGAAFVGLCCAAAIYVRSNLTPLLVLAPLALLLAALQRPMKRWFRLAGPIVALGVMALFLPPSVLRTRAAASHEFTPLKRLESAGELGQLDFNQTALYTHDAWLRQGAGDFHSFSQAQALAEMQARHPHANLLMAAESFAYLSGLLVHAQPLEFIGANAYLALPLCGRPAQMNPQCTNFVPLTKQASSYAAVAATHPDLEIDTSYLASCPACAWFDRLFQGYHLLLPPLAILSLAGTVLALRNRSYGLFAVALVALGNFAPFVYMFSPTDRYGLPFRVALIPLAVYALHCLCQALRAAPPHATCADRAPAAQTDAASATSR